MCHVCVCAGVNVLSGLESRGSLFTASKFVTAVPDVLHLFMVGLLMKLCALSLTHLIRWIASSCVLPLT